MSRIGIIDSLPAETRAMLEQELIQRKFGQLDQIVALLESHGVQISRVTVCRFSKNLRRQMESIQAATEAAQRISTIVDSTDDRSAAIIALVQSQIFDVLLAAKDAEEDEDPSSRMQILSKAARAIAGLGRASVAQKKWSQSVRDRIESTLTQLEQEKPRSGKRMLDAETLRIVREELYEII